MGEETILATVPVLPPRSRSPVLRRGEKYLISIACDEVHLHWCIHGSIETDLSPVVLWRTGHIPAAAGGGSMRERIATLSAHLPTRAHEYVFGSTEAPRCVTSRSTSRSSSRSRSSSSKNKRSSSSWYEAMASSISRPDLHVCVVSDIPEQTALLQHLWSAVPSVLPTGLGCTDFFTCEQAGPGRDVDGMRVHRLAMLRGAAEMYDFPALVLDCGGAGGACPSRTTYTASDGWGRIIGGGAGPGLRSSPASRLSPDSEARRDLLVDDELLDRAVDRAIGIYSKGGIGVAVAGGDDDDPESSSSGGKEDEIALVMIQLAMSVREVVDRWLTSLDGAEAGSSGVRSGRDGPSGRVGTADADTCTAVGEADERVVPLEAAGGPNGGGSAEPCSPSPKGADDRPMRYVVFTGVDGERMWRLCQLNYSSNGGSGGGKEDNVDPFAKRRVLFRYQNNLVHYGTAAVLMKILQCGRWTASEWRDSVRNRMEDDPVSYLGLRVARRFRMVSDNGGCDEEDSDFEEHDSIFRGSVVGIREEPAPKSTRKKVKYVIKYDDEDRATVTKAELLKMIELYRDVGERSRRENNDKRGDGRRRTRGAPGKPAGGRRRKKGKRTRTLPDGEVYVNRRVAKVFESEIFFGIVTSYLPPDDESQSTYWHVEYDDGDEEDFDPKDLKASFKLYECAKVLDNDDGDCL